MLRQTFLGESGPPMKMQKKKNVDPQLFLML